MTEWISVFESKDLKRAEEFALVLAASSIRWRLDRYRDHCDLLVPADDAPQAARELSAFIEESADWPPVSEQLPLPFPFALFGALVYGFIILSLFGLQQSRGFGLDWLGAGMTSARLIVDGEWWRTITALTLHSGVVHLAGNLFFGMLFGYFVSRDLGVGLAWFSILLSGALGNGINAIIRNPEHSSVGASTAIFGAVGILGAYGTVRRFKFNERGFRRWAPLIIAWILLGELGAGGERTDVLAHILGLSCGLGLGLVFGLASPHLSSGRSYQWWMGLSSLVVLGYAWLKAF